MNYADSDKVLAPWLKRHGLHVFTKNRDEDVRYFDVVDDAGGRYQYGSLSPTKPGRAKISVDLEHVLEVAYCEVTEWIREEGRTKPRSLSTLLLTRQPDR